MKIHQITWATAAPDGDWRRPLWLHVPPGPAPAKGWPLLIMLDGESVWPLVPAPEGIARCAVLIPGHGAHGAAARAKRALDYTPPAPDGGRWPDPRRTDWVCGGANDFLAELLGPMLSWARTRAPLDDSRLSLFGHSYGGLCALYALARHPGIFAHIVAASPSLWWHDGRVGQQLITALRAAPPARPVHLLLTMGTAERWHPRPRDPGESTPRGGVSTLPALRTLHDRLAGIDQLALDMVLLDNLGHGDVLPVAARRAVDVAGSR